MHSSAKSDSGLKVVFAGTPEFAAHHLQAIIHSSHQLIAVFTQPDRKAGRGRKLHASPVKQLALQHHLPVYQPQSLKTASGRQELMSLQVDVLVVVAYGLILPLEVLEHPRLGCINVHASLLPRWRGAAPIQRAILAGDQETGITFMQMDEGLDTGAMLEKVSCPITASDNAASLHDKLANLGAQHLPRLLDDLNAEKLAAVAQPDTGISYAEKLNKQEANIRWSDSAVQIDRAIRAYNPWPVAYTSLNGETVRIWQGSLSDQHNGSPQHSPGTVLSVDKNAIEVATGSQAIKLQKLQFAGGKPLTVAEILNAKQDLFVPKQTIFQS